MESTKIIISELKGTVNSNPEILQSFPPLKISDRQSVDLISKFHPRFSERVMKVFNKYYGSRVIPLELSLNVSPAISSTDELMGIIERMPSLGVGYCYCRAKKGNCDNDLWTCIHIGSAQSIQELKKKIPLKSSSIEDIKSILRKADEKGLVHQLITAPSSEYFYVICNCCPCCCVMLDSARKFGGSNLAVASNFIAIMNDKCTNCGKCVDRCYFGARLMENEKLIFNPDKCTGCGLCVSFCEYNAIQLVKREKNNQKKPLYPLN